MSVFISVVSHNHANLINRIKCLEGLCLKFHVIIKSNIEGDDFSELNMNKNFHWINESYGLGFGANNNYIYNYAKNYLSMSDDDLFIVLNPDVIIESSAIDNLSYTMFYNGLKLCAVNLFRDYDFSSYDNSIRRFPSLLDFISSFLFKKNNSVLDKSHIVEQSIVDWAAGSFLAFKASHYKSLMGFDESYFMYCEDIDICYRSKANGVPLIYLPYIKAVHLAMHNNRRIFSKHFYWHLRSVVRFELVKHKLVKPSSTVNEFFGKNE